MAEWNFRLRAALDDDNNVTKMIVDEPLAKVGPKGYVHGWIKVGGDGTPTSIGDIDLTGPGWTQQAAQQVSSGIALVHETFPNADPIKKVEVNPDQQAIGNKSNTSISVSPMFLDKSAMDNRDKQWQGGVAIGGDGMGQKITIVHEYGHVLDSRLGQEHPAQFKELNAYLNEPITYDVGGKSVSVPRWQAGDGSAPSAYAGENRYEYVAEALADSMVNGDNAKQTSKAIAAIFHKAFGG